MNFDFATILVLLVGISGLIWLLDAVIFSRKRKARLATLGPDVEEEEAESIRKPSLIVDYARSFFPIFLIVLVLRSFLVEPFKIPSGSMMPTLLIGDFILVNKFDYGIRLPAVNKKIFDVGEPNRGDVVVFRYPEDPSIPYIKRVVGIPGDVIAYKDKQLFVNNQPIDQRDVSIYHGVGAGIGFTGASKRIEVLGDVEHDILVMPERYSKEAEERVIPEGHYFVLGDNRDNSKDSRFWGTVPDENLIGRAFMIWMNWDSKNGGIDWGRIGNEIN
ncbi:MAG: signal peptidase I [Acidobacteria bacterium]|nr:signal peptidase I [Acidobacteriota bacterium]